MFGGSTTTEKRVEEPPMSSFGTEEGATKTPLFLATRSGYVEIVQEILTLYPQAVEYIDDKGRNILHIAIQYRPLKIFKLVTEIDLSLMRLVRKLDYEGNSILHYVGKKNKEYVPDKMQGPALELQDELHWFEVLHTSSTLIFLICSRCSCMHIIKEKHIVVFLQVILVYMLSKRSRLT